MRERSRLLRLNTFAAIYVLTYRHSAKSCARLNHTTYTCARIRAISRVEQENPLGKQPAELILLPSSVSPMHYVAARVLGGIDMWKGRDIRLPLDVRLRLLYYEDISLDIVNMQNWYVQDVSSWSRHFVRSNQRIPQLIRRISSLQEKTWLSASLALISCIW